MTITITQPKTWTYDDYLALPENDGNRYEIIEGVLYTTPMPPTGDHQVAVYELGRQLGNFVVDHDLGYVLGAPFGVHLSEETRPVEPDLLFIRKERWQQNLKFFKGAPDLVVEILSNSTRRLDRNVKFDAYEKAGVPEYWIINPVSLSVEIWVLEEEKYQFKGEFTGTDVIHSTVLQGFEVVTKSIFRR
jgi:Uma2 family endonuclease